MPKKILHIIPSLSRGGAEILLCNSINLLPEYQHKIVLFETSKNQLECNAKIICLNAVIPKHIFSVIASLNRIIQEFKPDIINAHLYWPVIIIRLCQTGRIPVLQWYHSDLYNTNNKEQYSFKRLFLDKLTIRKHHHLVFVSEYLKSQISLKLNSKARQLVVYNFVDTKFFNIESSLTNTIDKPLKILVVGNLRKQKNQIVLLKALSLLKPENIETTIIGDGPEMPVLKSFISNHNLANILLPGIQTDIAQYLAECDLFIMPSLFEGFGISLLEAMAAKRPCLVSDIPIFREIGGQSLIYFNPTDPKDLSDKILFFKNEQFPKELGEKARRRALNFTQEKYEGEIRFIYTELML